MDVSVALAEAPEGLAPLGVLQASLIEPDAPPPVVAPDPNERTSEALRASPADRTSVGWVLAYRQGFYDAADGVPEVRRSEAYDSGYRSGLLFACMVSGTTRYVGDPHWPGWPDPVDRLPPWLRAFSRGARGGGVAIVMPGSKYGRGGDRRSQQFKSGVSS